MINQDGLKYLARNSRARNAKNYAQKTSDFSSGVRIHKILDAYELILDRVGVLDLE